MWSYHTTPPSTTRETPFSLVYGTNAMIPVEVLECSHKFQNFTTEGFDKGRRMDLDLLDEVRNNVRISSEALKRRVELKKKKKQGEPSTIQGDQPGVTKGLPLSNREQVLPKVVWPIPSDRSAHQ